MQIRTAFQLFSITDQGNHCYNLMHVIANEGKFKNSKRKENLTQNGSYKFCTLGFQNILQYIIYVEVYLENQIALFYQWEI